MPDGKICGLEQDQGCYQRYVKRIYLEKDKEKTNDFANHYGCIKLMKMDAGESVICLRLSLCVEIKEK